jgi:hypothetical protein
LSNSEIFFKRLKKGLNKNQKIISIIFRYDTAPVVDEILGYCMFLVSLCHAIRSMPGSPEDLVLDDDAKVG